MGLYGRFVLPRLVDYACRRRPQMRQREKIVPAAAGRVLEIGFGSGLNLPFYEGDAVEHLYALDPSREILDLAAAAVRRAPFPVTILEASAEAIPLASGSVDTVVITYTLCTVRDPACALREMARVLAPGGRLLFSEHGAAPDPETLRWQRRLDPLWSRLAGGCHLSRPVANLLDESGFRVVELTASYIPGWKPASFTCWGIAVHAGGEAGGRAMG